MADWYRYHPGRTTVKGVEVCEYNREGRPDEKIVVVAHAVSLKIAQNMCMYFNRALAHEGKEKAVSKVEPLPGAY
ncbi:hypothetical protein FDH96_gp047 [Mycobacterium phage Rey]|uniref:Uncharacterized protein n=1 Tax=Mycobacterium phage Rey TaxID=1034115 RepID=G1D5A9_9CAUD|nr:hypothetical protein FDH96_gp047 [Mycobacterium phage Rey]AEK09959.1 hypothetical protein PBI_REY_47 [Mycobacterium phage Rey]